MIKMQHEIYPSISEMTRPETLHRLVKQPPNETCLEYFVTNGWSSTEAEFLGVNGCNGDQPRYIIKRLRRNKDWVMAATNDHNWRSITVWQQGLLDRLPEEITHGIIACSVDEEGFAILMHNVSQNLLPEDKPLSETDNVFILDAMAALHAAFWQDSLLGNQKLNLCKPKDFFSHTSPVIAREIAEKNPSFVLEMIVEGRRLIPKFVDADIAELMNDLVHDPTPLCTALAHYPQTLVHSDVRVANLGLVRGERPRLIMLDWARQTRTVPAVDLIYFLVTSSSTQFPISFEQSIDLYKQHLAQRLGDRFDESWWQPQLKLSLLGTFSTMACFKAWGAEHAEDETYRMSERADLQWWAEQARLGIKWLA
jgi:hypothetical protein